MDVVGALERAVDGHAVRRGHRDDTLRLDVDVLLAAGAVLALDHEVGLGEAAGEVALLDRDLLEDAARALGVEDRLGRAAVEPHRRRQQPLAVLVGQEEDRLLGVAHLALDEEGLVVLDERDDVAAGDVAVIDDGETRPVEVEVDGGQLAGGDGGADGPPVQQAGEAEVVDVPRHAAGLVEALPPGDAPTHDAHGRSVTQNVSRSIGRGSSGGMIHKIHGAASGLRG